MQDQYGLWMWIFLGLIIALLVLAIIFAIFNISSETSEEEISFMITINGEQVSPSVNTKMAGTGQLILSVDRNHMTYNIFLDDVNERITSCEVMIEGSEEPSNYLSHIQQDDLAQISGKWNFDDEKYPLTEDIVKSFMDGKCYLLVRTNKHKNGIVSGKFTNSQ